MMGPRARLIALSSHGVRTWLHFSLGTLLLIGIAASVDFASTRAGGSFRGQALSSFVFALELVAGAAVAGTLLWLVMRALKGKGVQEFRDSVLWSAYLIAALVMILRIVR